jgi:hypothetical protein
MMRISFEKNYFCHFLFRINRILLILKKTNDDGLFIKKYLLERNIQIKKIFKREYLNKQIKGK